MVAGTMSGKGYLVVGDKVKEKCSRCYAELSVAAMIIAYHSMTTHPNRN